MGEGGEGIDPHRPDDGECEVQVDGQGEEERDGDEDVAPGFGRLEDRVARVEGDLMSGSCDDQVIM